MRNTKERSAHDRNPQESIRGIGSLSRLGTFCAAAAGFAAGSFFARIRAGRLIPRALWIILILIGGFIRIRIGILIRIGRLRHRERCLDRRIFRKFKM